MSAELHTDSHAKCVMFISRLTEKQQLQNKIKPMFYVPQTFLTSLPFFDLIKVKRARGAEVFSVQHTFPNLYFQHSITTFQPHNS
jgi:hypothetical protein